MKKILLVLSFFPLLLNGQIEQKYTDYLRLRDAVMDVDSAMYFDQTIRLNPQEIQLNKLLQKEQAKLLSHYKSTHFFPPARNFYQSKAHIERTKIFSLIQQMPKGGILHIHLLAMTDAEWVVKKALELPEMHSYWGEADPRFVKGQLQAFKKGKAPAGFFPTKKLQKRYPAFADSLYQLITFDENIDRDSVDIWNEFESIFQRIYRFVTYEPVYPGYLERGLDLLVADNIQHVELRVPFRNDLYSLKQPDGDLPIEGLVSILEQAVAKQRQTDPYFTLKVIHTDLRFKNNATIWQDIQETVAMKKRYPEWLKGYDLVAEEDNGEATLFHAKTFLRMDSLEAAMGVELPLYLHDGESDWASVANLYDAILLGTRRIGHGFNLFRFPHLLERVKADNICVEVSPLSNQILGYLRDLRIHPASTYLRRGVDCVISSDDPLIFDYKGLSYDFWSVYMAWELDLAALKKLCKNSLTHGALSPSEKAQALAAWEAKWTTFVETAITFLKE